MVFGKSMRHVSRLWRSHFYTTPTQRFRAGLPLFRAARCWKGFRWISFHAPIRLMLGGLLWGALLFPKPQLAGAPEPYSPLLASSTALTSACVLFRHSWYSLSGTES